MADSDICTVTYSPRLGYLGHETWRDMSDYLVHLTGNDDADGGHGRFSAILGSGMLRAGANGVGTARTNRNTDVRELQRAVSLSEIPLGWMQRLTRHGEYGLGFTKSFVRAAGGAPVWYLHADTPAADAFQELMNRANRGGADPTDPVWKVTPFIDNPRPGVYEFDWEREWRVPGQLAFEPGDVAFIFAPGSTHGVWIERLFERQLQVPVLDPTWPMEQFQQALATYQM